MRFTSAVAVAASVAPLAVSATGKFGYALGVRHSDGSCKSQGDFTQDFQKLQSSATKPGYVRTYAAIDGGKDGVPCSVPGQLLPAAQQAGIKVVLGVWADTDHEFTDDQTETLKYAKQYSDTIYAFTVGSEGLYRAEQTPGAGYSASDLLKRIGWFKGNMTQYGLTQRVGTADSWNKYQDGTADILISGGVNLMLINAFGYWQSQDISNASATYLDDLQQAFGHIQSVNGSTTAIELWTGETGWPTDGGSNYHDSKYSTTAVAGTANAQTFWKEGVCAALDWNYDVFYFEAFAEPWKPQSVGLGGQLGDETHWGAYDANRNQVIPDLSCSYP